jgi:uncharacterized protein (DUF1330 family)
MGAAAGSRWRGRKWRSGHTGSGEQPKRVVIYQYPNMEAVHASRNDPDYQQVRKVGEKYATYRTFAIEGLQQ